VFESGWIQDGSSSSDNLRGWDAYYVAQDVYLQAVQDAEDAQQEIDEQ